MLRRYRVTWITKEGGHEFFHEYFFNVASADAARWKFDLWYSSKPLGTPRAYRIKVETAFENK